MRRLADEGKLVPYVQAAHDYGSILQPLGIVLHMAEGGGTVGYLSRSNPRGVSVHFVVERSGRIVQMLGLDKISGSVNPFHLRYGVGLLDGRGAPFDAPETGPVAPHVQYGFAAVTAVLGIVGRANPNRHLISIEVEGFARTGPNSAQVISLQRMIAALRMQSSSIRGLLGHRDFQSYKACPGHKVPWQRLGGHGLWLG